MRADARSARRGASMPRRGGLEAAARGGTSLPAAPLLTSARARGEPPGCAPLTPMRLRYTSQETSDSLLWPERGGAAPAVSRQGLLSRLAARSDLMRPPGASLPHSSRSWRPRRRVRPRARTHAVEGTWRATTPLTPRPHAPRLVPIVRGVHGESLLGVKANVTVRLATSGAGAGRDCAATSVTTHSNASAARARRGAAGMAEERAAVKAGARGLRPSGATTGAYRRSMAVQSGTADGARLGAPHHQAAAHRTEYTHPVCIVPA